MVMMENVSPVEAIRTLGTRFKDYRMRLNLTQRQVSELRRWILNTTGSS